MMKKIIRYLIIAIVAAIGFVVVTVGIFVTFFDANAYQDDLAQLVHEQTGRRLSFHGDIGLTYYPALGMKLGAMSLSNPVGFDAGPMIKVKQASISVDLASLVAFAPEIDKLVLRDLEINLLKQKNGANNWDDLIPVSPARPAGDASAADASTASEIQIEGAFGGLDLQNIQLTWRDEQSGDEYRIKDLDLNTGRITPNTPFPLNLKLDASANGEFDILLDLSTDVDYQLAGPSLALSKIRLALNEYLIEGRLELSEFAKATPTLRFDLQSGDVDVDALLATPAVDPAPAPASVTAAGAAVEDPLIRLPMQILRELDIDGRFAISQLKVQNLKLNDVDIAVKAQRGRVGLQPLTLSAYGGQVKAALVVDVTSKQPRYRVENSIQGLQAGAMLMDYSGQDTLSGTLNVQANLTTGGERLSELKRNINGQMALEFIDGAFRGFNLRQSIEAAKAKLRGQAVAADSTRKTDFSSLTISGPIRNGVFSSDDLNLQAPLLRVGGAGNVYLISARLDYQARVKIVGEVSGQQGEVADQLAGLEIPVSIKGPFDDLKIDILLDEILRARARAEKEALKAEIEQQKAALKAKLEKERQALAAAKKRELEKQREVAAAKAEAKLKEKRNKAKKKLEDKLKKLLE